jgi:hypothetical protein
MAEPFDRSLIPQERRAPAGKVWRCALCRRWALDQFGEIGPHAEGWDESCLHNSEPDDPQSEEERRA